MVVICPSRRLHFGDPLPVAHFLDQRVRWIELKPSPGDDPQRWPWLQRLLALLVTPELQLRQAIESLRERVNGRPEEAELLQLIPAILTARLSGLSILEICAMSGITLEDFSQSPVYREIFGLGEARGEARGEASVILRLLNRRCGSLSAETSARIQSLPLERLDALAEALLDFNSPQDLHSWLQQHD